MSVATHQREALRLMRQRLNPFAHQLRDYSEDHQRQKRRNEYDKAVKKLMAERKGQSEEE